MTGKCGIKTRQLINHVNWLFDIQQDNLDNHLEFLNESIYRMRSKIVQMLVEFADGNAI